jgi:hypothetical protein
VGDQSTLLQRVRAWDGVSRRRRVAVGLTLLAGLYLAGVPTYYAVFVRQATRDPVWVRIIVFVVWVGLALYVLWRAWGRDELIDRAMSDRRAVQRQVRTSATEDVLDALTKPGVFGGLPESYELTIYLYDSDSGFLEPYYPHLHLPAGQKDPRRFEPGRGAAVRRCPTTLRKLSAACRDARTYGCAYSGRKALGRENVPMSSATQVYGAACQVALHCAGS